MNLVPKRKLSLPTDEASAWSDTISLKSASIISAMIQDASITTAKIASLAVTDAKIDTLSVTKLTTGNITFTGTITSGSLTTGATGISIKSTGINIWGANNALTTRATETGTIQCSVNSAGAITAGAGKVVLDSVGITVGSTGASPSTGHIVIKNSDGDIRGYVYASTSFLHIAAIGGDGLELLTNTVAGLYLGSFRYMVLPSIATEPSSPSQGWLFYDTDDDVIKYYDGAAWKTIATV